MTSKERVLRTLEGKETDRVPFGIFGTSATNEQRMVRELGLGSVEEMYGQLGLDVWHLVNPLDYIGPTRISNGREADYWGIPLEAGQEGNSTLLCPLMEVSSIEEVEKYSWPNIDDFSAERLDKLLDKYSGFCIDGGLWAPIFHNVTWLCGFETTLINLVVQPEVSAALIRHVTDFWIAYCKKVLDTARGRIDIMHNCNDFGAQQGLILSRDMFLKFFLPEIGRMYDTIHGYGVKTLQHSCGAVSEVIGDFIGRGADIMNPIQVSAQDMNPNQLAAKFSDSVAFYGGIDTQHLLPEGTETEVREATRATLKAFKDCRYILGPSQGIEADIPTANVVAMFDEGKKR